VFRECGLAGKKKSCITGIMGEVEEKKRKKVKTTLYSRSRKTQMTNHVNEDEPVKKKKNYKSKKQRIKARAPRATHYRAR